MRLRTLLFFALLALAAATAATPPAAVAAETKLEVNENCVEPDWPCWATPGSSQPALKVTIAEGGSLAFVDHGREANIAWTTAAPTCEPTVPVAPAAAKTGWEGKCTFATAGTYRFESSTLFDEPGLDYTKYEVTVAGAPKSKTISASADNQTEATFEGSVSPEGNATEYQFEYGVASVSEHTTPRQALGAEDFANHNVSASASGLSQATTYHVRLTVLYGLTQVHGSELELTTPAAVMPEVKASPTSGLGETVATLKGTVDPEGEATSWVFEYGLSEAEYVATSAVVLTPDNAVHSVSAALTGLSPGREYSFRLLAENGKGSAEASGTFKTVSPPPPPGKEPTPETTPTPVPGPTSTGPAVSLLSPIGKEAGPVAIPGSLQIGGHGSELRGSIGVGSSGAGGRLRVELLVRAGVLGLRGSKQVVVGRLTRASLHSGTVSFAVALSRRARLALRHRGRLAVTAKVLLAPSAGKAVQFTRTLTLRA